jgi:hypothetical protein
MIIDQPIGNVFKGMWRLTVKYRCRSCAEVPSARSSARFPEPARYRGLDVVRGQQEVLEGAGEIRHRSCRRHRRIRLGEQQRARRRVDPGARLRHSGRLDHGDRDRRALHEEHEPGPALFVNNPQNIYAVYLLFVIANLIMIPLGYFCIKVSKQILRVPRNVLMPVIMLFCVVGPSRSTTRLSISR